MKSNRPILVLWLSIFLIATMANSQEFEDVQYTPVRVTENIYMLQGAGGNIGCFFGPDGLFLIDDQFAPLHQKLLDKIEDISNGAISGFDDAFLINTHFHHDHTGGNELIGESGGIIFAHENVRQRLSAEQYVPFFDTRNPALKPSGLPVIVFKQDITFHLNGDSLLVFHLEKAHTDGDLAVHFTKANVIHSGDILFTGTYPFIDIDNGGSTEGLIKAVEKLLTLCDDNTIIIPGHGEISNTTELREYHNMLTITRERVRQLQAEGRTLEQVQAANPTAEFDDKFDGFISNNAFVGLLFRDLSNNNR